MCSMALHMIRKILFALLCVALSTSTAFADISGFVFTTPAQTILPNTLSDPITIQLQNGSGAQEATAETMDLAFISTSPTGQFLSSTGKPASKTMAKGTSNRTFYYSDTVLGTYTLIVTAIGRASKQSFSATQQITIASALPPKPAPIVKTTTSPKTKISKPSSPNPVPELVVSQTNLGNASTSNVATVYEGAPKTSAFDSLFDWPGRFWNWLISIF